MKGGEVLVCVGALDGLLELLESWTNVLVPREGLFVSFSQQNPLLDLKDCGLLLGSSQGLNVHHLSGKLEQGEGT